MAFILLAVGCGGPGSNAGDPPSKPVTSGNVHIGVEKAFLAMLAKHSLRLVWTPAPCSWRLTSPACGGAPVTDPATLDIPVAGGTVSFWDRDEKVRGRLQLSGRLEVIGGRGTLALDDMSIDPKASTLAATTASGRIDALFLDGSRATFHRGDKGVDVGGAEVKMLAALSERIGAIAGGATVDLVKVGDLEMKVGTS